MGRLLNQPGIQVSACINICRTTVHIWIILPLALEHLIQMSTDTSYAEGDRDRDKGGDSDRGDKAEKGLKQKSSGSKCATSRLVFCQRIIAQIVIC